MARPSRWRYRRYSPSPGGHGRSAMGGDQRPDDDGGHSDGVEGLADVLHDSLKLTPGPPWAGR